MYDQDLIFNINITFIKKIEIIYRVKHYELINRKPVILPVQTKQFKVFRKSS